MSDSDINDTQCLGLIILSITSMIFQHAHSLNFVFALWRLTIGACCISGSQIFSSM